MISVDTNFNSPTYPMIPAMFSLAELESYYVVAVDIPTIPSLAARILTSKGELTIEGTSTESHQTQTLLRFLPKDKNIKTLYENGVLWLLLPKFKIPPRSKAVAMKSNLTSTTNFSHTES